MKYVLNYFSFSCDAVVKKGMLFNINIGFTGLVNKDSSDPKGKDVALFVGDSVLVNDENDEKPTTILTPSKKKIKNIAIFLKDEDSDDEDEEKVTLIFYKIQGIPGHIGRN